MVAEDIDVNLLPLIPVQHLRAHHGISILLFHARRCRFIRDEDEILIGIGVEIDVAESLNERV